MQYVIAAKREFRDQLRTDWVDEIQSVAGLTVCSEPKFGRLIVEASDEAIEEVRAVLGGAFHIEPISRYSPQSTSR